MDVIERAIEQWHCEVPGLNTEPLAIIGRILRISKHLESEMARLHKLYELKPGEFDVLVSLFRSGAPHALTPSDLIDAMILTSGAMTNRLDKLEHKSLIVRIHSEIDRRSVKVQLTESGYHLINNILREHIALQENLIAQINPSERPELNQLLTTWLSQFE
ncbi:MarR family transcriptional regulator [Vibrio kasasachensis]|uniref:MarR family winged helix-turn-helix transcriptional regulator n=1 Tax=Vibrio kasasachensis TaxID=2910248 RepID=UPI003D136765